MKKLTIAAIATVFAVVANAASMNWGFAHEVDGDPSGDLTGYTAYLIAAGDWNTSDVAGSLSKATDSAAYANWSNDSEPADDYFYYEYSTTKGGLSDSLAGSADYYIVFANDSKYSAIPVNGTIIADGDNTQPTPFQPQTTLALDTSSFSSYSGSSVPEPTSGLLMLLGVAGLALRRRRA